MYIIVLLCIIAVIVFLFYRTYAPFGGRTSNAIKQQSPNFSAGKFVNQTATDMAISFTDALSLLRRQLAPHPHRKPSHTITAERPDSTKLTQTARPLVTWFGHSTFLLEMNSKAILFDPIFSNAASPVQAFGPKRFSTPPITVEQLPPLDAVVISHDHYDHLDYGSIKKLTAKTKRFFVPLGLRAHLVKWGVAPDTITELDWWDESTFDGLTFACVPSRHFSGRTLTDRFATLWCSWVVMSNDTKVYFSGDSGYGPHFKQIGDTYGAFDLTLLECGQYDSLWPGVHMTPEQTMQAHIDLKGKRMIPMHWGAFALALHDWTEPVERVLAAASASGATVITPKIGEPIAFKHTVPQNVHWWKTYNVTAHRH